MTLTVAALVGGTMGVFAPAGDERVHGVAEVKLGLVRGGRDAVGADDDHLLDQPGAASRPRRGSRCKRRV